MALFFENTLKTGKEGLYNITREITAAINKSKVSDGIAIVFCPHTTAAITITENTDRDVCEDILLGLEKSFHDRPEFKHREGNSSAHLKSSAIGCEITIIIRDGWPLLGVWQAVFFCEFDGPRERKYYIKIIEDK